MEFTKKDFVIMTVIVGLTVATLFTRSYFSLDFNMGKADLPVHPKVLFTAKNIASGVGSGEFRQGFNPAEVRAAIINAANRYAQSDFSYSATLSCIQGGTVQYSYILSASAPPEPQNCKYPVWNGLTGSLMYRMVTLAVASALEPNQPFATKAKSDLLAISAWSTWTEPQGTTCGFGGVACKETYYLARSAAIAYDILYPILTDQERQTVQRAIIDKAITPFSAALAPSFRGSGNINTFLSFTSGIGLSLVSLWDELSLTDRNNAAFMFGDSVNYALSQHLPSDGGTYESIPYMVDFEGVVEAYHAFRQNKIIISGMDLPALQNYLKKRVRFLTALVDANGLLPNFNDAGQISVAMFAPTLFYDIQYGISGAPEKTLGMIDKNPSPFVSSYGIPGMYGLFWKKSGLSSDLSGQKSSIFKKTGIGVLRSPLRPDLSVYVKIPAEKFVPHQHFDIGSFHVSAGSLCVVCDLGYPIPIPGLRPYGTGTVGHNSIIIDGFEQNSTIAGKAQIIRRPAFDGLRITFQDAYPSLNLSLLRRNILFLKSSPGYLIGVDTIRSSLPHFYERIFHNRTATFSWSASDQTLDIQGPNQNGSMVFFASGSLQYTAKSNAVAQGAGFDGIYASLLESKPTADSNVAFVLFPRTKGESFSVIKRGKDYAQIQYAGSDEVIVFNPARKAKQILLNSGNLKSTALLCVVRNGVPIAAYQGRCSNAQGGAEDSIDSDSELPDQEE